VAQGCSNPVVVLYLGLLDALFVNTECCIQLNDKENPDKSGPHWYCDAIAVDFREKKIYPCEISFEISLGKLVERLKQWAETWDGVRAALSGRKR
jgi:hypothetical protein